MPPSSITRLIDLGAQPYLIAATLLGVLAQRLIRTLCPHCKQTTDIERKVWNNLIAPAKARPPKSVYKPIGCDECRHSGYLGRIGIYEALHVNVEIRNLINSTSDLEKYHAAAAKQNMRTLRISGAQKIAEGLTTLEEIFAVVHPMKDAIEK